MVLIHQCKFCGARLGNDNWSFYNQQRKLNRCNDCSSQKRKGVSSDSLIRPHALLCRHCGDELTDANWPLRERSHGTRICVTCNTRLDKERYQRTRDVRLDTIRRSRQSLRKEIIAGYGGLCECCGESNWEFLTIDHVNGDGSTHRKELMEQGTRLYTWLKRNDYPKDGFRLLCFNCNCSIGFLGYCPHRAVKKIDE
jgi:hypothetical protein